MSKMKIPVFIAYDDDDNISYSIVKNDRFIYMMTYTIGRKSRTITYSCGATIEIPRLLSLRFPNIGERSGCKVIVENDIPPICSFYSDIDILYSI